MKTAFVSVIGAFYLALVQPASAEILQGVEPLSSLGEIKARFPNGRFERVRAAWVKDDQAFFSMIGEGFPGKLMLVFDDSRPFWRGVLNDLPPAAPDLPASLADASNDTRNHIRELAFKPEDDALVINWVRWVPAAPIPMERVRAKFGDPSKCDFDAADFSLVCTWESRALLAQMSDDRKSVEFFTTGFTKTELRSAYKSRGREIPAWLSKEEDSAPKKPAASAPGTPNRKVKPLL